MPRLRDERSPYEGYTGLIMGRMNALHLTGQDLAVRMGISITTMYTYIKHPGNMRLETIRKLNRVLGIKAEEARERIPMW